ncbi:hypothetical protein DFQ29_002871 [Apophysomyces sp. BC1021]|nr:hypothetical protein DFQ29_002871 [Apophysomyces sp. BC1021]
MKQLGIHAHTAQRWVKRGSSSRSSVTSLYVVDILGLDNILALESKTHKAEVVVVMAMDTLDHLKTVVGAGIGEKTIMLVDRSRREGAGAS